MHHIYIIIIIIVAIINLFYPIFNTNSKKLINNIQQTIYEKNELDNVDKQINTLREKYN